MGLEILSRKYRTQTRGAVDLDVLQACIGEEIKVITELAYNQIFICYDVNDQIITFVPDPNASGRPYNNDLMRFSTPDFLAKCQVGDQFISTDGGYGVFTLLEKIDDLIGRFDKNFASGGFPYLPYHMTTDSQYVANITPLKSLLYQFGINENGGFLSPTDNSIQKFTITSADPLTDIVSQALSAFGNLDWQIDSAVLVGLGDDPDWPADTQVRIKITHTTVVTPLFLVGELSNLQL
jgi:hypothetical protein